MADDMEMNEEPSTKDDQPMDYCERHKLLEKNLREASAHRKYIQDLLNYELRVNLDRNTHAITKHQKDVADLKELMEHLVGELALPKPRLQRV
ncbi:hypothetical protein TNCT_375371 [Trichonephila clavata]|uniref:Uncharacterized protein n=1 Tax=Trichonephila clavata TaxID=2740835 RepID=A0A8X6F133_TRICU|nr:hypothetical protein TNCT_375371 [Trichonephila clavata]